MGKVIYIDAPEMLTRRQRTVGALLTGIMWAAYAYLWLPLISLFAWGLGIEFAYDVMVRAGGADALREALFWYGVVLLDVILTVAMWSLLNKWRFAGHNRRTAHEQVGDAAMADYFGVSTSDVAQFRTARRIEVEIDSAGRPFMAAPRAGHDPKPDSAFHTAA